MSAPTEPSSDRRRLLLFVTGGIVLAALVAVLLATVIGDGDGDGEEEPAPPVSPVRLTTPLDTSGVIDINGSPVQLPQAELDAIVAAIERYIKEASVIPLSGKKLDDDATTTTDPDGITLADSFTGTAGTRLSTNDRFALSDAHLPRAENGVSVSQAAVALSGIAIDGTAQFVNADIVVVTVARGEKDITVTRRGDLVLRLEGDAWKIAGYDLTVERDFGDRTTTTEAAFG